MAKARTTLSELRRRAAALSRVTAFAAFVAAVVAAVVVSQARAELTEQLFQLGSHMLRFTDGAEQPTRSLAMNGERIYFASGITREPLDRVLDAYERRCGDQDGQIGEQM